MSVVGYLDWRLGRTYHVIADCDEEIEEPIGINVSVAVRTL